MDWYAADPAWAAEALDACKIAANRMELSGRRTLFPKVAGFIARRLSEK